MTNYEHLTITQLGDLFGITRNKMGKRLEQIGLRRRDVRTRQLRPSQTAFEGGFVKQVPSRGDGYMYVWHREKTIKALEGAGFVPVRNDLEADAEAPEYPRLVSPFRVQGMGGVTYAITNRDGASCMNVAGKENAEIIAAILNRSDDLN